MMTSLKWNKEEIPPTRENTAERIVNGKRQRERERKRESAGMVEEYIYKHRKITK